MSAVIKFLGLRGGIALLLGLALIGMTASRAIEHRRAAKWQHVAGLWKDAHGKLETSYRLAQVEATAKAKAQIRETENRYVMAAWRADNAEAETADLRRRADDYARRNRVSVARDRGSPGGTVAAAESGVAAGSDGPGADAVVLARADFDTLIANTSRLLVVHGWGQDMLAQGLAMKLPAVEAVERTSGSGER